MDFNELRPYTSEELFHRRERPSNTSKPKCADGELFSRRDRVPAYPDLVAEERRSNDFYSGAHHASLGHMANAKQWCASTRSLLPKGLNGAGFATGQGPLSNRMNEYELRNEEFYTPANAMEHYEGLYNTHRSSTVLFQEKRTINLEENIRTCKLCKITCQNANTLQDHLNGAKHRKARAALEIMRRAEEGEIVAQGYLINEEERDAADVEESYRDGQAGALDLNISERIQSSKSMLIGHGLRQDLVECLPGELLLEFELLFCKLCLIHLSSVINAGAHYTSMGHMKKVKEWMNYWSSSSGYPLPEGLEGPDYGPLSNRMKMCELCNEEFDTPANAVEHYNGRIHSLVVSEERMVKNPVLLIAPEGVRRKTLLLLREKQLLNLEDNTNECKLCKITCTNVTNLQQHLNGGKHRNILKQLELKKEEKKKKELKKEEIRNKLIAEQELIISRIKRKREDEENITKRRNLEQMTSFQALEKYPNSEIKRERDSPDEDEENIITRRNLEQMTSFQALEKYSNMEIKRERDSPDEDEENIITRRNLEQMTSFQALEKYSNSEIKRERDSPDEDEENITTRRNLEQMTSFQALEKYSNSEIKRERDSPDEDEESRERYNASGINAEQSKERYSASKTNREQSRERYNVIRTNGEQSIVRYNAGRMNEERSRERYNASRTNREQSRKRYNTSRTNRKKSRQQYNVTRTNGEQSRERYKPSRTRRNGEESKRKKR